MYGRQAIPAGVRRKVLVEAGHRCAIQVCRKSANVEVHHITPWAKCQEHRHENLIVLCPNCHKLADGGIIDRKALEKYKKICQNIANPSARHYEESVKTFIKFDPNTVTRILDAKNVAGFTDCGILDFSIHFEEPFEDQTYVVNALGDGTVNFRVANKTEASIRIQFDEPCPNIVRLEFKY